METPRPLPAFECVHCRKHFGHVDGAELPAGVTAASPGTCVACRDQAEYVATQGAGPQPYLCPPVASGTLLLLPVWLCPIGDYRHGPDHWLMDTNARLAYFTLLFPVAIIWLSSQKFGRGGIGFIFLLILGYPFFANHQLGTTAILMDPRFRTSTPSGGAIFLWVSALALLYGLEAMFAHPDRFEPMKVTYRRTAKGFLAALTVAAALLYGGSLLAGFWRDGEFGLRQQLEAGLWRTGLLTVPLGYFLWTVSSSWRHEVVRPAGG